MSQENTQESVSPQDRRELVRKKFEQHLQQRKEKYNEKERIRYALKVASESPEEKANRLRRRRENVFLKKVLRKDNKHLEETYQECIANKLIASDENLIELEQNQELNLSKSKDEVKHINTFVKQELGDYPLGQPNNSDSSGGNSEEKDVKECYEHVYQFSEQTGSIWPRRSDLESRSHFQQMFMKNVHQKNYSDNCIKQELDDNTFPAVSNSDQSNQINNIIVKQELDDYSVLSTNSEDQVECFENCIKQELDDNTIFPTDSPDPLEDKNFLEHSSVCHVENESQEYGNVEDQLNSQDSELDRFECVSCDLDIKAEETSEKILKTTIESTESNQNIHFENEKYECSFCDSSFSNKTNLVRHIADIHFKVEIYLCEFCNDTFESKQGLNKHINAIHVKKKDNICTFCKAIFMTNHDLRIHIDSIHLKTKKCRSRVLTSKYNNGVQVKRKKFPCQYCNANFQSHMGLNRHITIAHIRKERYICHLCQAGYTTERYLRTHLEKIHLEKFTPMNSPPMAKKNISAIIPVGQSNSSNSLKTLNHNLNTYLQKRSERAESICLSTKASFTVDRFLKSHIDNIDSKKESLISNLEQPFNSELEKDVDSPIPVDQSKFPWRYNP